MWVVLVTVAAFGPYIVGSIRTEQVVAYLSLLVVFWLTFRGRGARVLQPTPWPVIVALGLPLVVAVLVWTLTATSGPGPGITLDGSPLGGLDNLLLPIAVILIVWQWLRWLDRNSIIRLVSIVTILALALNCALALLQMYGLMPDGVLEKFWSAEAGISADDSGAVGAVGFLAVSSGRYSGIFNQPAEAGIAYSIGLVACLWLATREGVKQSHLRNVVLVICFIFILVGGLLTVSKVLLIGAPLGLLAFSTIAIRRVWAGIVPVALVLGAGALIAAPNVQEWPMVASIQRTFGYDSLNINSLTAGRLGSDGQLQQNWDIVLEHQPLFGFGLAGADYGSDSLWSAMFAYAGAIGLAAASAIFLILLLRIPAARAYLGTPEIALAVAVLIIVFGASLGIPSLTANREATLVWLFLGALLVCGAEVRRIEHKTGATSTGSLRDV